jgi:hypothetical protein
MKAAQLQDHLYTLEERLLHPDREQDRSTLALLLAEDYREFCTSGRIMNRQQLVDILTGGPVRPATIQHYNVTSLSPETALATYNLTTAFATSHRSSLWILRDNRWQLLFHQGTVAA